MPAQQFDTPPVLIAGAGPAGLIAALVLLRNGVPVRLIEKNDFLHPGSRGCGIQPRTMELLHQLGATDLVRALYPLGSNRSYRFGTLDIVRDEPFVELKTSTVHLPYPNPLMIGQCGFEGYIRSHLAKYGCEPELGTELTTFEQDENGVTAHLSKNDGNKETVHVQYLIGTDGARGATRKGLGLSFTGNTPDTFRMLVGDVRMTCDKLDYNHWHRFGDFKSKTVMLRPMREVGVDNDGWALMIGGPEIDIDKLLDPEGSKEVIFAVIQEAVPAEIQFKELVWKGQWKPNMRMVDKFGVGRVFVAGDAAHVHSPTGGQGLNSSVQDAINLSWKLALVLKNLSPPSLLDSYSAERLPVIAEMLNITTELFKKTASGADDAWKREDRLRMLGVNYRRSPIVLEERSTGLDSESMAAYGDAVEGTTPVAGDRAPDAARLVDAEGKEYTFFDLFRVTHHSVLIFASDVNSAKSILDSLQKHSEDAIRPIVVLPQGASGGSGGALALVDRDGHAYSGYKATEGETVVVILRPDGFVGAVVNDVEGVGRYLQKVFF
ncbi:hypothetical protein CONPUDRAFT_120679 [Coniophora puteana RWD-64-598 SS2]|uniref:FAD-binding domain-containing protein n=1 Tax=Coniophora puteana (strain RWD-64-598) TaxID=741705 RepID=A0A5M3MTU2_CONPW|nr:uncharacterized protein CONPUDRAFT_120679 [Coniophora puteana RWD-64-598 SS2]EIW82579.1 hypothetical protein CONPUDRAFT_120679 [Coniophora puteana RWD-64-598 SS2]